MEKDDDSCKCNLVWFNMGKICNLICTVLDIISYFWIQHALEILII